MSRERSRREMRWKRHVEFRNAYREKKKGGDHYMKILRSACDETSECDITACHETPASCRVVNARYGRNRAHPLDISRWLLLESVERITYRWQEVPGFFLSPLSAQVDRILLLVARR